MEAGADKNSATYKNFVQMFPITVLAVTPDDLAVIAQTGEVNAAFAEITFTGTGYSIGTVRS